MQQPINAIQVVPCDRCGVPCRVATESNEDARLLRKSTKPQGYCADCGVAHFLQVISPMGQLITDPAKQLLWEPAQKQFAEVMKAGGADLKPEEINWGKVVLDWALPFPEQTKKARRRSKHV
jgi:hypothetical protein